MNKETIKNKLIELQKNIIRELEEQISNSHTMVDIDEDDTHDPEDYSHMYESKEIEQMVRVQLNRAKGGLMEIESMDFSPKNTVTSGAIVETDKMNFLIGCPTVPFDIDDKHLIGISMNSPIYPIMADKKEGNEFSFSGNHYTIKKIY